MNILYTYYFFTILYMTHTISLTERQAKLLLMALTRAELHPDAEATLDSVYTELFGIVYKK